MYRLFITIGLLLTIFSFTYSVDYHASHVFDFMETYSVPAVKQGNLILEDTNNNYIDNVANAQENTIIKIKDIDDTKSYNVVLFKPHTFQKELDETIHDNTDLKTWKQIDSGCQLDDIIFTYIGNDYPTYNNKTFQRAGCNSTLGGKGYSTGQNNQKFYQRSNNSGFQGLKYNCRISSQNNFKGNNNTNCPCPNGRHIPNSIERNILDLMIEKNNTRSGGIADQLNISLLGFCNDNNCYGSGQYTFLWLSQIRVPGQTAFAPFIAQTNSFITLNSKKLTEYYPVRCVKDN